SRADAARARSLRAVLSLQVVPKQPRYRNWFPDELPRPVRATVTLSRQQLRPDEASRVGRLFRSGVIARRYFHRAPFWLLPFVRDRDAPRVLGKCWWLAQNARRRGLVAPKHKRGPIHNGRGRCGD